MSNFNGDNVANHPFTAMSDNTSRCSEREPLITPPPTVWTEFNKRHRNGKLILVLFGSLGIMIIMFAVLGSLGVFHNTRYRNEAGVSSIGKKLYPGKSSGSWANNDKNGSGDGTYYDPGVGYTACGTLFTAVDYVVAMNAHDFGESDNPNESPVCGACIIVTGPNGSQKAQIQDICPPTGCGQGSVDMTPAIFNNIGDITAGRIPISWKQC